MKTSELISILQALRQDDEIVVKLSGVGQRWHSPQTPVVDVLQAFDWEYGKTFLLTETPLVEVTNNHPKIKEL